MSESTTSVAVAESASTEDDLVNRIFQSVLGFNEICLMHIGEVLGLYRALADHGELTAVELARQTGTHERYVQEWLEAQAVSGILKVDSQVSSARDRRYSLPAAHVDVLTNRDHPSFMAAFARMQVGMMSPIRSVIEAFRSGGGVDYADYGEDFCDGQGDMNRIGFVNDLCTSWLPAIPEVHHRLSSTPPARVADVACGVGWSTISMARGYPNAQVEGIDLDELSIERARDNAAAEGMAERVRFRCMDAAKLADEQPYDLITVFEAVHDMSQPVEVLRSLRGLLAPDGVLLIADERVAESFTAPGDEVEQLMYGWSVLHCLPVGMADQPSAATGTAMRPATLEQYAAAAGFGHTRTLDIDHDFWRFYLLHP